MDRTRASYDAVAETYADTFSDELDGKPIDRGLLDAFAALCSPAAPVERRLHARAPLDDAGPRPRRADAR